MLVAAVITSTGGWRTPDERVIPSSDKTYRSTDSTPAGNLAWYIVDCATGKTVGGDNKILLLRDIAIIKRSDEDREVFYDKRIELEQGFYLEMDAGRDGVRTFSWEWFDVDGKSHATKRQELGSLEISVKEIDGRWEVVTTKLLSDVSFRIHPEHHGSGLKPELLWRVNVGRGSEIIWPSLVGQKIVSNG